MKWLNHSMFSQRIKWFPRPERGCLTSRLKPGAGDPTEIKTTSLWFLVSLFSLIWGPACLSGGAWWVVAQVKIAWLDLKATICHWKLDGAMVPGTGVSPPGFYWSLTCLRLRYKLGFNTWIGRNLTLRERNPNLLDKKVWFSLWSENVPITKMLFPVFRRRHCRQVSALCAFPQTTEVHPKWTIQRTRKIAGHGWKYWGHGKQCPWERWESNKLLTEFCSINLHLAYLGQFWQYPKCWSIFTALKWCGEMPCIGLKDKGEAIRNSKGFSRFLEGWRSRREILGAMVSWLLRQRQCFLQHAKLEVFFSLTKGLNVCPVEMSFYVLCVLAYCDIQCEKTRAFQVVFSIHRSSGKHRAAFGGWIPFAGFNMPQDTGREAKMGNGSAQSPALGSHSCPSQAGQDIINAFFSLYKSISA